MASDLGDERATAAEQLAAWATCWMLQAPDRGAVDKGDGSLYGGRAGILLAVHSARAHVEMSEADVFLERGIEWMVEDIGELDDSSLYFGLTGTAYAPSRPGAALVRAKGPGPGSRPRAGRSVE